MYKKVKNSSQRQLRHYIYTTKKVKPCSAIDLFTSLHATSGSIVVVFQIFWTKTVNLQPHRPELPRSDWTKSGAVEMHRNAV